MSPNKHFPAAKKWALFAVLASVAWIPFPPEVVIPGVYALTGSKLLAFSVMSLQSVVYILYFSASVRILLSEDINFFQRYRIGKAIFKSIERMRNLAQKKPNEHWSKELVRLFLAWLLCIIPMTLTFAVVFPILIPKPRYYIACWTGTFMRNFALAGFADTIVDFFKSLVS